MKNFGKVTIGMLAFMIVSFISCGGDDDSTPAAQSDSGEVNESVTSQDEGVTEKMSPVQQKAYLDKIGKEFMGMVPSGDFQAMADLARHIDKTYIDGKSRSWENVEKWAKDCFDAASQATGVIDTDEKENRYEGYEYTYVYIYKKIYTNYNALLIASNFTGHFTYTNGKWMRSDANDLQFLFTDQNGQLCELKLATSGNVVPVHATEITDRTGYDYENKTVGNISYGYSNSYYDRTELTIGVPENIVVTLTQNGSDVIKTTIKTNLSGINNEEFDISKSSLTFNALIELNNGYKLDLSQVAYSGNNQASVSFAMTKNGQNLITIGMSSSVSGLPSWTLSQIDELRSGDLENADALKGYVSFDLIGKAQIKGEFTNARKFYDYINSAKDNQYNEAQYKSYINQANSLVDLSLYYGGTSNKQASIKLEPFQEQKYYGRSYWVTEPIIQFYDGSSYSTFSAFFNETDFKGLIDTFKSVADQYAKLINEKISWDEEDDDNEGQSYPVISESSDSHSSY